MILKQRLPQDQPLQQTELSWYVNYNNPETIVDVDALACVEIVFVTDTCLHVTQEEASSVPILSR